MANRMQAKSIKEIESRDFDISYFLQQRFDKKKYNSKEKILLKIFSETKRTEDDRRRPEEKKRQNLGPEDGQAVSFEEDGPNNLAEIAEWV